LFAFNSSYSQQPAFSILGENQFKGVQVYDVVQDNDLNYWFATNEGLYLYNHYNYQKVECDKAKSNSIFNFVIKPNGIIYCNNLNSQIFQIKNKSCSLFYELQPDEISSDISLAVTGNNQLLVGAKKIIQLSEDGAVVKRINIHNHYLGPPYTDIKNNIYYHLGGSDSVLQIYNDKSHIEKLTLPPNTIEQNSVLKFFSLNSITYAVHLKTKALFLYNTKTSVLSSTTKNPAFEPDQWVRMYFTDDKLWLAGTLPGVQLLDKGISQNKTNSLYKDYFISDVYKDHEGNILLSTFDKGILVVPDLNIPDVINSFRDDPVTSLLYDSEMGLLMGSSKGQLMSYQNKSITILNDKGKRPIEHLYSNDTLPFILFDDGLIRVYNKRTKEITSVFEASLKDAVIVSDKLHYLGTNIGIKKIEWNGTSKFTHSSLKNFTFRIYSMALNPVNELLYASTSKGLFCIQSNGEGKSILFNSEVVFPNNLYYHNGKIYAADKKEGVLVIENEKVIGSIKPIVNGEVEVVLKFIIYNNTIIAKTYKGLLQFDLSGKLLNSLSTSQGYSANRIIDFTIQGDQLWVSHTNGVQEINLNALQQKISVPRIQLSEIAVNDSITNYLSKTDFAYYERKIQFTVSSPTLRNRENIRYHYKLEGNDSYWSINNYDANKITYNALAPGDYTFYVKSEKQGVFSEVVAYSFSIASPVYSQWWFITIAVSLFLLIVYFIYKWQLNIQRKKSQQINELNASKLTAIQSQMNPHFIFNSLNSIQDLILKGDVEHSYSYITTFSNLVRRTLSYSDKDFIDFEQEIKLIELYLSLEKLRFKKDFSFTINTNDIVDVQIPPMLIQPFIENALVHGLLHKEGEKKLTIHFELKDTLICVIEDNGVGRDKSKAIKLRQRSEHESFSGKAIHKRFEILSNVFEGNFGYTYEDLQNESEVTGTRVTLIIPVKHKF
jgi:ligand-binding sensor domain-containing protein